MNKIEKLQKEQVLLMFKLVILLDDIEQGRIKIRK
jgi:hypothetical protein